MAYPVHVVKSSPFYISWRELEPKSTNMAFKQIPLYIRVKDVFVRFSEFVVILKFMITKLGLQIAKCQMSVPSLPNSMILHVQDFVGQCPMSKTFLDNGQLDIPSETTD